MTWRGSRQSTGIKARGDIAEVWQEARQVGVIFRWSISGFDGNWSGYASKYRLDAGFEGGEVEIRFQLELAPLELIGAGHIIGVVTDGGTHSGIADLKGTRLWLSTGIPVSSGSS